jgi:2-desacetyl-2-hydroxyethyl bacteriochlorophyllide A dehydrogenase
MKARQLWFTDAYKIEVQEHVLPALESDQLLVKTHCSAISAGTEMLVYRGQLPYDIALDATIGALQQTQSYPLQYGYACVGEIEEVGGNVCETWLGKRVFAFQPHASHFVSTPENVIILPNGIEFEAAVFLANMETAVNLVLDGKPILGEKVVVLGQGIVGLLLSSLLAKFPLSHLYAIDAIEKRRQCALQQGVNYVFSPNCVSQIAALKEALHLPVQLDATANAGADLIYEVSGATQALDLAIELCCFSGRIVLGSWYGSKSTLVQLGGVAHRNRITFMSSQVSTIAPELAGRWDKARRFEVAWQMIGHVRPQSFITHKIPIEQAGTIYALLDQAPEDVLQAIFIY